MTSLCSGFWDHSFSPCHRFRRYFAQMLLRIVISSAVNNLSSSNVCVSVIGVLFLLVLAMVTLSRLRYHDHPPLCAPRLAAAAAAVSICSIATSVVHTPCAYAHLAPRCASPCQMADRTRAAPCGRGAAGARASIRCAAGAARARCGRHPCRLPLAKSR